MPTEIERVKRTKATDTAKVQAILDKVQARCRVRTFEARDILEALEAVEHNLGHILPKCHWRGLRFDLHAARGTVPSSYKGVPETTYVRVERGSKAWFITHCARTYMRAQDVYPLNLDERTSEIMEKLNRASHWSY